MRRPLVEILYFDGCPNHKAARALVEHVAAELGVAPELRSIRVPDAEAAVARRFVGSPTVRVDGRDVEPRADDRSDFVLACRVYRTARGVSGRPDPAWIRSALVEAAA